MKKTAIFILMLSSLAAFAQKLSDYKYVSLPAKLETFKEDFGLRDLLAKTLQSKNYIVVSPDKLQWPSEANDNPCNVLMANIVNDSGLLRNKVVVKFKDCNGKEIQSIKGTSDIKENKEGYQDALKQTLVSILPSNQKTISQETTSEYLEKKIETEKPILYNNNKKVFKKIKVSSERFKLVNSENESLYATFTNSFKKDIFRVEMQNGAKTLGYREGNSLFIEVPLEDGKYQLEEFIIQ